MKHHTELKGRALLFLLFLWFLWFNNLGVRLIFSPILPLVEDEFAVSHARAGSVFIFQSIGYGLSMFFSGFFSGRLGYKKSILLSLAVSSLVCFSIPFVKVFSAIYLFSFLLGFSTGIYLPSVMPLLTEYFDEKNWGKSIAIHDSAASISIFSTPFLALFLLRFFNWRGIFPVFAGIFLLIAFIFLFLSDEFKIRQSEKTRFRDLIRKRSLWIMAILWVFAGGANMGVYFVVPLYLTKELGLSIGYANTILGVSRLGGIAVAILCGFLVDRFSLKKIMFAMLLLTGFFTVGTGVASVRWVGVSLFLQALVVTGFFPLGLVSLARMFDREIRGLATGLTLTIGVILGGGMMPYLLGLSGDLVSFRFGLTLLGTAVILSCGLVFFLKEIK
ncbi:MAG: MFS transporter [Deltaproteobacteria bacterium]|nr:MFS transporter [Deltaproteobacteria bacterium]